MWYLAMQTVYIDLYLQVLRYAHVGFLPPSKNYGGEQNFVCGMWYCFKMTFGIFGDTV